MESTLAKPLRKRRRWLIVAFILVLVSLTSWWYWPRGDARFVGRWRCSERYDGAIHERTEMLEFLPDGYSHIWLNWRNGIKSPERARWWVDGDDLVTDMSRSDLKGLWNFVGRTWRTAIGDPVLPTESRWRIVSVSPDVIQLAPPDNERVTIEKNRVTSILTRIPE
jgi:hypothetical protein